MFDLAIIGYGPVGAVLANLLGQRGLNVLVLEKDSDIYRQPRAIHFDGEVMRVFESAGLRPEVETVCRPGLKGMYFVNAQGQTLLIRGGGIAKGPHGCATNYYFHQPDLEDVLRSGVQRYPNVEVKLSVEVHTIEELCDCVTLHATSPSGPHSWQARYVVGADGARSIVRKTMGSTSLDLGLDQPWLVFDALLKNDSLSLPDHTVQHCDPMRPMTYCNVTTNRRRWEIMLMPGDDPQQLLAPESLWRLVSRWITPKDASIERATIYTFHSVIAQGWRKGRLLLAGDAAHQMPPFLGQGMCAGIRDASNLAWKLEAVIKGLANDTILDSYEAERASHVRAFVALAVKIGNIIQTTDPMLAAQRDAKFLANGSPEVFQFPTPNLGPSVLTTQTPNSGSIFPQPLLSNGARLDTAITTGFAVIGTRATLNAVSDATKAIWAHWEVKQLIANDPELHAWLASNEVDAVVLRPDRYILGIAKDALHLNEITQVLAATSPTEKSLH
jgi:3-(3-hydroxy-phenyl)propionate hydroxylase